jgi:hypothetical protein
MKITTPLSRFKPALREGDRFHPDMFFAAISNSPHRVESDMSFAGKAHGDRGLPPIVFFLRRIRDNCRKTRL